MLFVTVTEPRIPFALVWFFWVFFFYYFGVCVLLSFSLKLCRVFCQICVQVLYIYIIVLPIFLEILKTYTSKTE